MTESPPSQTVRFATFDVDLRSGELRKNGTKIKLQEKPFQLLVLLLERPGVLITRTELRDKLWPADTFVDFDHSLGTAIAKLRQALGDSAQNPRFVETVSGRGYRFVAPLANAFPGQDQASSRAFEIRRLGFGAAAGLLGAVLLLVVFLGFDIGGARQWLRRRSNPSIRSLAVLPLENLSGDPQQEYFADGMTEELIARLAQLQNMRVISRTSVMQYKGAKKRLPEIASELHVDAVVEGSVVRAGQQVRITAQLLDATRDQHLWAQSYQRESGDVLVLQSELSRAIAQEIAVKLTPQEQKNLTKSARVDPVVHEDYLRGRYHLNNGGSAEIRKGIEYFDKAINEDPRDSRSYAGLAESYLALDDFYEAPGVTMPKAQEAAYKAVDLDPDLAEAHTSLGAVHFLHDWDWAGAEKEMKRAIELNPGSSDAHMWYADFLAQMGHSEQAISEIQRAEALDPLSLAVHVQAGWVFYLARKDKEATAEWGRTIDLEPNFAILHTAVWAAYLQKAEFRKVLAEVPEAQVTDESTVNLAAMAGSYAVSGRKQDAKRVLAKLSAISKKRYVCAYEMGTAYAILGDKDKAVACLRKAYEERSSCMTDLKADPRLDSLRSDPRFHELLRNVGFSP
jgi:TolB-like protein/DNA-binding winged helix-turn-helix (wHTH) protein/thioredoxin-like negative regulator of GroEL